MEGSEVVPTTTPVLVTLFLFTENIFFLRDCLRLEAAFILVTFLFALLLATDFFRFACFFLFGMRGVYATN